MTRSVALLLSGVFGGGGRLCDPLWADREFLDNFCTAFLSFVSRLNRKIRVPRLLPVKTASKLSFWGQKWFFLLLLCHKSCITPVPTDKKISTLLAHSVNTSCVTEAAACRQYGEIHTFYPASVIIDGRVLFSGASRYDYIVVMSVRRPKWPDVLQVKTNYTSCKDQNVLRRAVNWPVALFTLKGQRSNWITRESRKCRSRVWP